MVDKTQLESIETVEVLSDDMIQLLSREISAVGDDVVLVPVDPIGKITMFEPKRASSVDENTPYITPASTVGDNGILNDVCIRMGRDSVTEVTVAELNVV